MHVIALKHHLTDASLLDWVYLHGRNWLRQHYDVQQSIYNKKQDENAFERGVLHDMPFVSCDHTPIETMSVFYEWVFNKCHSSGLPFPQTVHHCRMANNPNIIDAQYNTHIIVQHVSLSKKMDCNGQSIDLEVTPTLLVSEPLAKLLFLDALPPKTNTYAFARWVPVYLRSNGKSGWITHTSRTTRYDAMCMQWCQHILYQWTSHAQKNTPKNNVVGGVIFNVKSVNTPKFYILQPPQWTLTPQCGIHSTVEFKWKKALIWALLVRREGAHWNPITNNTHIELCSPASQTYIADHWKPFVKWLCRERADMCNIHKITQIQREKAWTMGARNFHDVWNMQTTLSSVKLSPLSLQIIWTNHKDNPETIVLPRKIKTPIYRDILLKTKQNPYFIVDFETIQSKWIFMVATVYYNPLTNQQHVFTYRMKQLNNQEQVHMLHNWIHTMQQFVGDDTLSQTPIFHWSPAEPQFLKTLFKKNKELLPLWNTTYPKTYQHIEYDEQHNNALQWKDLCVFFLNEPITVRGCFDFQLKHIIKALVAQGKLPNKNAWSDNGLQDGLTAMHMAEQAYKEHIESAFIEIQKYNEADTLVLHDLIRCLLWNML